MRERFEVSQVLVWVVACECVVRRYKQRIAVCKAAANQQNNRTFSKRTFGLIIPGLFTTKRCGSVSTCHSDRRAKRNLSYRVRNGRTRLYANELN